MATIRLFDIVVVVVVIVVVVVRLSVKRVVGTVSEFSACLDRVVICDSVDILSAANNGLESYKS